LNNLKSDSADEGSMARTVVKTRKIGGSLMVTIPKEVVEQEDIREGELLELEVRKARRSWFGATPGIRPFTHEDEGEDGFDRK
jgi:antitoxin component of MazEF toxin-antitoxin module